MKIAVKEIITKLNVSKSLFLNWTIDNTVNVTTLGYRKLSVYRCEFDFLEIN